MELWTLKKLGLSTASLFGMLWPSYSVNTGPEGKRRKKRLNKHRFLWLAGFCFSLAGFAAFCVYAFLCPINYITAPVELFGSIGCLAVFARCKKEAFVNG